MSKYRGPRLHSRRFRLKDDDWWGYAFIFVAMLVFCVFTLYPVLSAVKTSFLKYKPFGSEFIGLKNYADSFKSALFFKAVKNTIVYTVVVVPLSLLIAFSIAIMILPFKKGVQSVFKSPRAWRCPSCGCGCMTPRRTGFSIRCSHSSGCRRRTGSHQAKRPCSR